MVNFLYQSRGCWFNNTNYNGVIARESKCKQNLLLEDKTESLWSQIQPFYQQPLFYADSKLSSLAARQKAKQKRQTP